MADDIDIEPARLPQSESLSLQQECIFNIVRQISTIQRFCRHNDILIFSYAPPHIPYVFKGRILDHIKNQILRKTVGRNQFEEWCSKIKTYTFATDWEPAQNKLSVVHLYYDGYIFVDLFHMDFIYSRFKFLRIFGIPCVFRMDL